MPRAAAQVISAIATTATTLTLLLVPKPILPQFHSPLLRLPGEIRNKIYEYALKDSKPLRVIGNLHKAPYKVHATRLHQFNTLKHTCRQLRTETACMGVSPADASFHSSYNTFSQTLVPGTRQLECYKHDRPTDRFLSDIPFDDFVFFCQRNPQLEVAIFTQALRKDLGCRGLLVAGAALQRVLRRKKLPFQVDAGIASDIRKMAKHMHKNTNMRLWRFRSGGRLLSGNIKVYPMEEYDEAEVRYSYLQKKKGFEDWVAQIREWYKNGI